MRCNACPKPSTQAQHARIRRCTEDYIEKKGLGLSLRPGFLCAARLRQLIGGDVSVSEQQATSRNAMLRKTPKAEPGQQLELSGHGRPSTTVWPHGRGCYGNEQHARSLSCIAGHEGTMRNACFNIAWTAWCHSGTRIVLANMRGQWHATDCCGSG